MLKTTFFGWAVFFLFTGAAQAKFARGCETGESITLAAVGDVLLHGPLQAQAYRSSDTNGSLWRGVTDLIEAADIAYANLEGPTAEGVAMGGRSVRDPGLVFDRSVYSGFPLFNYNPVLTRDLKKAGFDIVSTANNHAMDRGPHGVDKTIAALEAAGLPFTGTRTQAEAATNSRDWHTITRKNGWSIAWIACTFSTNGLADPKRQVLGCFRDAAFIESQIRALYRDPSVDAVVVTPHWGEVEYTERVEPSQRNLAKRFAEAGAAAIFGNHPHVTKTWEKITTSDGRETFVIYSIGNFVSNQQSLAKRTSAIIYLGLTRAAGQKAWVNGMTYVPLYMVSAPYEVVAVDRSNRASREAYPLLARLLGADRRLDSRERIDTNPECH